MFGINTFVIYAGIAVILFCGGFVNGCSYHSSKAEKVVREKEHEYQAAADTINPPIMVWNAGVIASNILSLLMSLSNIPAIIVPTIPSTTIHKVIVTAIVTQVPNFLFIFGFLLGILRPNDIHLIDSYCS